MQRSTHKYVNRKQKHANCIANSDHQFMLFVHFIIFHPSASEDLNYKKYRCKYSCCDTCIPIVLNDDLFLIDILILVFFSASFKNFFSVHVKTSCLMPISNHFLCLKIIDFFYKSIHCQRIWNIPSPCNYRTCCYFRI